MSIQIHTNRDTSPAKLSFQEVSQHQRRPRVAVVSCIKTITENPLHTVQDKYLAALLYAANVLPMILPAHFDLDIPMHEWLDGLDGIFLTGSPSNIAPWRYQGQLEKEQMLMDPRRDAVSFPMIEYALSHQMPLFAVCRGHQELNVAMGGTLHQYVHELPGHMNHREDSSLPLTGQYDLAHSVTIEPGGRLEKILGKGGDIRVNSLHSQGIKQLGGGLSVEARAPDGLIEAISVDTAKFALSVQWHPEWQVLQNPDYQALFTAFGDACRDFAGLSQAVG